MHFKHMQAKVTINFHFWYYQCQYVKEKSRTVLQAKHQGLSTESFSSCHHCSTRYSLSFLWFLLEAALESLLSSTSKCSADVHRHFSVFYHLILWLKIIKVFLWGKQRVSLLKVFAQIEVFCGLSCPLVFHWALLGFSVLFF